MKNYNGYLVLTTVLIFQFLVVLLNKFFLNTDKLIFNFYSEQFTLEQVDNIISILKKWEWIGYVVVPLLILIRSSLVALCLNIGVCFYDTEANLKFKQFLKISLVGEFVLILIGVSKFCYFYFIKTDYTLQDLQQYYPLSYINFLDIGNLELWLIYPLQIINLFEIIYFLVLVYGLYKLLHNKFWKSFEMVAVSYGTGLVIWMGLVMFLTLNYS